MMAYLSFEVRRLLRIRTLLAYGTLVPLAIYLLVTQSAPAEAMATVMVMVAGIGAIIGVLTHGAGIAYERADGWVRQLRVTPLPPSRVVAVRGVVSILTVIPPLIAVTAAAGLLRGVALPPGRWLLVVLVMVAGAVPFALLGLAMGYTLTRELTGPATSAAWLVLASLGGLIVPVWTFPAWLQAVTAGTPAFRYAELGWRVVDGAAPNPAGVAVLAGWTLLAGLLAAAAYRRSSVLR